MGWVASGEDALDFLVLLRSEEQPGAPCLSGQVGRGLGACIAGGLIESGNCLFLWILSPDGSLESS